MTDDVTDPGTRRHQCDVCHLPDPYSGSGDGIGSCDCPRCDGIGSCDCPRCDGGEAASGSVFCDCPPDDEYDWRDEESDHAWHKR